MPFGATVAGDMFWCMLDECFGKIKQVITIADDIMIVGYKPDHSDHDQSFTNLLQIAQNGNMKLNYNKLQYKQDEVEFFGEHIPEAVASQVKMKCQLLEQCLHQP